LIYLLNTCLFLAYSLHFHIFNTIKTGVGIMNIEPMEMQPPEWEKQLEDVTVKKDYREVVMDPSVLSRVLESGEENPIGQLRDVFDDAWSIERIADAKRVIRRKMKGKRRDCMLLLLSSGNTFQQISEKLLVSTDTVKRYVEYGVRELKNHFGETPSGEFPSKQGKRPVVRSAVFSLDTAGEKQEFQQFVNDHVVTHLAYSAQDPFREALVVYLSGKAHTAQKPRGQSCHPAS
jgi:hypothetical protein